MHLENEISPSVRLRLQVQWQKNLQCIQWLSSCLKFRAQCKMSIAKWAPSIFTQLQWGVSRVCPRQCRLDICICKTSPGLNVGFFLFTITTVRFFPVRLGPQFFNVLTSVHLCLIQAPIYARPTILLDTLELILNNYKTAQYVYNYLFWWVD